ncbi:hypothetical protein DW047_12710 [Phocaeicola vulgatus]|nr:hypothetical protein DW047_12710 [Phocaeicola vulgatus]
MAKKKQEAKLKEPVRIRFKQLANGNQSIYLDYYTGDVILWNENLSIWTITLVMLFFGMKTR